MRSVAVNAPAIYARRSINQNFLVLVEDHNYRVARATWFIPIVLPRQSYELLKRPFLKMFCGVFLIYPWQIDALRAGSFGCDPVERMQWSRVVSKKSLGS